jgi:hypothetical protein
MLFWTPLSLEKHPNSHNLEVSVYGCPSDSEFDYTSSTGREKAITQPKRQPLSSLVPK